MKMNENEDLLELKIEIEAEKDLNYQELAILFDNRTFLEMLPKIRKDFEIEKLVSKEDLWGKTYEEIDQRAQKEEMKKINFSKYKNPELFTRYIKENDMVSRYGDITEEMDFFQFIETELHLLCFYFKRPPNFIKPIREALFCGKVDGNDFRTGHVEIMDGSDDYSCFNLPYVSIFITPVTTYQDVKEMFWLAKDMYKSEKQLAYYKPRADIVSNIRKYRHWYWKRLDGNTYEKIARNWVESQLPKEDDTTYIEVLKGVKIYEKLLKQ